MATFADRRALASAAWRTWGGRGMARRGRYEAARRSGLLKRAEGAWPASPPADARLAPVALDPSALSGPPPPALSLYGGLPLAVATPPDWHRHPITGHRYDADAHWSELSDADADAGDIKDLWELGRFGWLIERLRSAGSPDGDDDGELIWSVIEDWYRANPRYRGPQWMCGQETSLRAIAVVVLARALDGHRATTAARRRLAAQIVHDSVGRVRPTLGYALSQRNNHATSEAGFLWSAAVLAPWLPEADRLKAAAGRALTEAVEDQFATDGSYSQHSPTYARVALHVLLWCLAVERSTGVPVPAGVRGAVARGGDHLRTLLVPGSPGRMPNLGGNDGALVFPLTGSDIGDFRPVLRHIDAALDRPSTVPAGPWDEEAACFGVPPGAAVQPWRPSPTRTTHALTRAQTHLVVRAGPLAHRPAHADQLHVDLWLGGEPVAVDPGTYRYTAAPPWGNALAGEEVHNLMRRRGVPQAQRAGRFFWSRWSEGQVGLRVDRDGLSALEATLELPDGSVLRRVVAVGDGVAVVLDDAGGPGADVRWNLTGVGSVSLGDGRTEVAGRFQARLIHHGRAIQHQPSSDDPTSGWEAPTYAQRQPLQAITVASAPDGRVLSVFTDADGRHDIDLLTVSLGRADVDVDAVVAVLGSAVRQQR